MARQRPGADLTDVDLRDLDQALAEGRPIERARLAAAARTVVARLAAAHPGRLIEVRVPPFAAAQLGDGTGGVHTRGTPPNVVQLDAPTLLGLATGRLAWAEAVASGAVHASGTRSDLSAWLPLPLADIGPAHD